MTNKFKIIEGLPVSSPKEAKTALPVFVSLLEYWRNADKMAKIRNEALLGIWVALDNMGVKKL